MPIKERLTEFFTEILDTVTGEKRRLVLLISAGVLAGLLVIFIVVKLLPGDARQSVPEGSSVQQNIIPPGDLFLPDEPDFIPGVILEREQRTSWTVDDAMPWWQDPLKNGEEQWRTRIEKTVDEIMENVP